MASSVEEAVDGGIVPAGRANRIWSSDETTPILRQIGKID